MKILEVGDEINVNKEKTIVLGRVRYSSPLPEYAVKLTNTNKCWLEPNEEKWKLWKEISDESNPVIRAVKNSSLIDLVKSTFDNFHLSSHGEAIASEAIGNTWGVKVGEKVELWRGENMANKEWPLFIVERNKNGITLWVGQYVTVV